MTLKIGVSSTWKPVASVKVGVGGAWKTVSKMWIGVGGVWKEYFTSSGLTNEFNGAIVEYERYGNTAVATARFNLDGTITRTGTGTTITDTLTGKDWYLPTTVGIGSSYWMLATPTFGTLTGNDASSWVQLSTNRSLSVSRTSPGTKECTVRVDISDSAGGAVLATGSITLSATYNIA